ncbi:MAG: nucleotidyltransferase domain-containing protein [Lawsonibacter sp.]|jgi:predicted nucleotidyltransferase|nr:nucleotidyltransferase domain-containing protein [Lawsonibacter sp.]
MVYTLDEIAQRIRPVAEKYHLRAVYVFGSYARGEAREDSDVDLVIDDTDSGLRGFAYGGLYGDLRDALEKDIDMVPVSGLDLPAQHKSDADFREAVQKERREIYAVA